MMTKKEVFHSVVHFSGRVQGVGFRYHTLQIAKEFEISGYVRNLSDGRVQLEAEGSRGEVDGFISEINDRLSMFIRKLERTDNQRQPEFSGFTITG